MDLAPNYQQSFPVAAKAIQSRGWDVKDVRSMLSQEFFYEECESWWHYNCDETTYEKVKTEFKDIGYILDTVRNTIQFAMDALVSLLETEFLSADFLNSFGKFHTLICNL